MVLLYVKLVYLGKQEVKTAAGKKTYEKRPLILVTTGQLWIFQDINHDKSWW